MSTTPPDRSASSTALSIEAFARHGGPDFYEWFNRVRVILMFILGAGLIIYSAVDTDLNVVYIITGAVLVGLIPIDQWLQAIIARKNGGYRGGGDPGATSTSR